jgi:DNA-binding NtrC family response regulator
MKAEISALLVHGRPSPLQGLEQALQILAVKTNQAQTISQAKQVLEVREPPELVFTDTQLPDGTWTDVVRLGEAAAVPVNVIVVSRLVDVRFYVEVIEGGAFDFIAPPFEPSGLAHVVYCAAGNVLRRRGVQAHAGDHGQGTLALAMPPSGS